MRRITTVLKSTCSHSAIGCALAPPKADFSLNPATRAPMLSASPPSPPAGELEILLTEIERALDAGFSYLAVLSALALPDICGALESEDGRAHPTRYKGWYTANLATVWPMLTADECYSLRCGVLHQGRSEIMAPGGVTKPVAFKLPDPMESTIHGVVYNDAMLLFEADLFCDEMIEAVRAWHQRMRNDPTVQANLPNLVRLRPHGFPPVMVGAAVIA